MPSIIGITDFEVTVLLVCIYFIYSGLYSASMVVHLFVSIGEHLPLWQVERRPAGSSPGSTAPLINLILLSFDEPGAGWQAHLQRQRLHAAVHPGQFGVEQRRAAHTQAVTGVGARGVNVQHRRRAGREAGWHVGAGQVLQLGVRWDLWREVVYGHTGVETVGVDFVQVSQAGRTAQRLGVQHPGQWEERWVSKN